MIQAVLRGRRRLHGAIFEVKFPINGHEKEIFLLFDFVWKCFKLILKEIFNKSFSKKNCLLKDSRNSKWLSFRGGSSK